jgi:hypothetical protein
MHFTLRKVVLVGLSLLLSFTIAGSQISTTAKAQPTTSVQHAELLADDGGTSGKPTGG